MIWGIFDTVDSLWIGNDDGPIQFDDEMMARVSAQVIDVQLGQPPMRTVAKEYIPGPKRLRDKKDVKIGAAEALEGIEEGRYI